MALTGNIQERAMRIDTARTETRNSKMKATRNLAREKLQGNRTWLIRKTSKSR